MSASFVAQLRTDSRRIELVKPGPDAITLRVEAADIWDVVRVTARPETSGAELKKRVVAELFPNQSVGQFVVKFRGWEILDERASLKDCGIVDGSILLIGYRRRRPVR